MKKNLIIVTSLLSILGIVTVAHAAIAPVVNAGPAQTITLPTNTVTLTGTATPEVSTTVLSTTWSLTPAQTGVTITTPTALTTTVTGLIAGSYVFTLTAVDNSVSAAPLTGTSTVTIKVNPVGTTPPTPEQIKKNMRLEITPSGQVNLQGTLETFNGTILTVKVYGILFTINTSNTKFGTLATDLTLYKVGDIVNVQGTLDQNASVLTVNAKKVNDLNIKNKNDVKNRQNDMKQEGDMKKVDGNNFPMLDSRNQKNSQAMGGPNDNPGQLKKMDNQNGNGQGKNN